MNLTVRVAVCLLLALGAVSPACASKKKQQAQQSQQPAPTYDFTQPLTLQQAIQIGLSNQANIGIAQAQLQAARARVTQAQAAYYPSIAPSYSYSNQLTTQRVNGQSITGNFEQSVTQISANQLIFDMGKREETVIANKYARKGSEFNVRDVRQSVIENVSTSYYSLLRTMALVKVAQSNVDNAKTTLDFTRTAAEVGTGARKDILQAEADYDNALVQLLAAQNNVQIANTSLKNSMGVINNLPLNVPDVTLPTPATTPDTRAVQDYLKLAFDQRPDLRREQASIDTNRHEVRIANINAGVQVNSSVQEGYRVDPDPGENRNFTVGVSYPLFDAGLTRAQVREAKASLEQARRQLDLTKQQVQSDVETAYLNREEARRRITATAAALTAAQTNYQAATESLREGTGTILDVITAQSQLVTAQTNSVQANYDFYTFDAQLSRATGQNDSYLPGGKI